ncbi:MAG TPA: hypothetical protein VNH11_12475 [Pirellulales bacterium]|nr:hypothetical protein [Pirellulales bacterium]
MQKRLKLMFGAFVAVVAMSLIAPEQTALARHRCGGRHHRRNRGCCGAVYTGCTAGPCGAVSGSGTGCGAPGYAPGSMSGPPPAAAPQAPPPPPAPDAGT